MEVGAAQDSMRLRLELRFAFLSAAGGMVLASGQDTQWLAVMAVFAAVFGFVFVDWLRVFELPPLGAYLGMGAAAIYCVRDFWGLQQEGTPQMVSVALLLVLVQAVLMLQRKSQRILEQLAVFCLLELIVAAIFSDAISFGLLIVPIGLVGASALSLLGWITLLENSNASVIPAAPKHGFSSWSALLPTETGPPITVSPVQSIQSLIAASRKCSRYAVLTLTPAVIVIAGAFFYVLPRKMEAERSRAHGPALTGFDDQVRLEQFGRVAQNPARALTIKLTEIETDQPYRLTSSLYLRGKVLENYQSTDRRGRPASTWTSAELGREVLRRPIPRQYQSASVAERKFYDNVQVEIVCEAMRRPSLFAIAPYYASGSANEVVHTPSTWCLSHQYEDDPPPFPRIRYSFGTHCLFRGNQDPWLAASGRWLGLLGYGDLLLYDRSNVPSAAKLAEEVVASLPAESRTQYDKAKQLEAFLARDPSFRYTLNLNATPVEGMDPIEQFLSQDRRGHCQYFASALAMMLRSQSIPCRLVVGYRTEEFNSIGQYYVARQKHAHAWVEALIEAYEMPENASVVGQPRAPRYWLRLDPTPGASSSTDGEAGSVGDFLGLANDLWEDYVVEMNADRQSSGLGESTGLKDAQASSRGFFASVYSLAAEVRAGRLRGGAFSMRGPLPLGWLAVGVILLGVPVILRVLPRILRRRVDPPEDSRLQVPALRFYADALAQLSRLGIIRGADETPSEFEKRFVAEFPSLSVLTDRFLRIRYGSAEERADESAQRALRELTLAVDRKLHP